MSERLLNSLKDTYQDKADWYKDKNRSLHEHYLAEVKEVERLIQIETKEVK